MPPPRWSPRPLMKSPAPPSPTLPSNQPAPCATPETAPPSLSAPQSMAPAAQLSPLPARSPTKFTPWPRIDSPPWNRPPNPWNRPPAAPVMPPQTSPAVSPSHPKKPPESCETKVRPRILLRSGSPLPAPPGPDDPPPDASSCWSTCPSRLLAAPLRSLAAESSWGRPLPRHCSCSRRTSGPCHSRVSTIVVAWAPMSCSCPAASPSRAAMARTSRGSMPWVTAMSGPRRARRGGQGKEVRCAGYEPDRVEGDGPGLDLDQRRAAFPQIERLERAALPDGTRTQCPAVVARPVRRGGHRQEGHGLGVLQGIAQGRVEARERHQDVGGVGQGEVLQLLLEPGPRRGGHGVVDAFGLRREHRIRAELVQRREAAADGRPDVHRGEDGDLGDHVDGDEDRRPLRVDVLEAALHDAHGARAPDAEVGDTGDSGVGRHESEADLGHRELDDRRSPGTFEDAGVVGDPDLDQLSPELLGRVLIEGGDVVLHLGNPQVGQVGAGEVLDLDQGRAAGQPPGRRAQLVEAHAHLRVVGDGRHVPLLHSWSPALHRWLAPTLSARHCPRHGEDSPTRAQSRRCSGASARASRMTPHDTSPP